jgi:hypothetical protein
VDEPVPPPLEHSHVLEKSIRLGDVARGAGFEESVVDVAQSGDDVRKILREFHVDHDTTVSAISTGSEDRARDFGRRAGV